MNNYAIQHATADKYCGKASAGGTIGPVPTLFYEYDKADRRRDVTCIPYRWNSSKQESGERGDLVLQQVPLRVDERREYGNKYSIKPILMRYADVLLMAAEAANELNDLPYAGKRFQLAGPASAPSSRTTRSMPISTPSGRRTPCSRPYTGSACSNSAASRSASRT
ncbi:MAG: RagB/SusD family nutrient uptake outer membrane protein [Alistipes senegalensis]